MVRPCKKRMIGETPKTDYFKPQGIPLRYLEEITLTLDETEALRLADLCGLAHEESGDKMGVSRQTFGRILQKARNKVADALINGKAINIQGGSYSLKE